MPVNFSSDLELNEPNLPLAALVTPLGPEICTYKRRWWSCGTMDLYLQLQMPWPISKHYTQRSYLRPSIIEFFKWCQGPAVMAGSFPVVKTLQVRYGKRTELDPKATLDGHTDALCKNRLCFYQVFRLQYLETCLFIMEEPIFGCLLASGALDGKILI